jgi:membrane associated rhomboid family serine protease
MPICPSCGRNFSGFSFGANVATECADCRKVRAEATAARTAEVVSQVPTSVVGRRPLPIVTLWIIAANVAVYLAMSSSGASWTNPNVRDAVKWGADFGPLTLSSDVWRLFTSTFVHFGIFHIALNMWCLWNLGATLEPFMGRKVFGVLYVASGLAASLVSVAWNPWRVSAGASGAIFGVAGALVSYFALKKTPLDRVLVNRNLKSLGLFIFYNLLYGVRGGVDNSAHLGGLVAGLLLGAAIPSMVVVSASSPYIPTGPSDAARASDEESRASRVALGVGAISCALLILGFAVLHARTIPVARYGSAVKLIKVGKLDQGAAQLQESVKLNPDAYLAEAMLGELLLQQQNPQAAVAPLERAAILVPDAYDVQHNLALAYLGAGRPRDALPLIAKSLRTQKTDTWRSLFVRGAAEAETGNDSLASADFRNAIQAKSFAKLVMRSEYWPLYP